MGLFGKKEEVPEIRPATSLPELPSLKKPEPVTRELPELPSFPTNHKNDNINQEMVKSAVADKPSSGENEVSVEVPKNVHIEEQKEESMIPPKSPMHHESFQQLPSTPVAPQRSTREFDSHPVSSHSEPKRNEPIFVRIDKFQDAQENFERIKEKVKAAEDVLGKIKEVKSQEEAELKGWTEDIGKIKSQLSEIDANIFSQI